MIRRGWRLGLSIGLLTGVALALVAAGEVLSRPAKRPVGPPPPNFPARTVTIPVPGGAPLVGWLSAGQPGRGAVLLLHGVRSDRRQMLARARFLARSGYATLAIDQQAHGESPGERITFGAREGAGVQAALVFLRQRLPGEPVAIIGVSLGAAATVLVHPQPPPAAVVLESLYPTIEEAVANRLALHIGPAGRLLAPLLLWQLPLRLDIPPEALQPVSAIARLQAPVLIASGSEDRHTPWGETERLFAAAAAPKELWRVEGAAHVDLHTHDPAAYEARIGEFLARHLSQGMRQDESGAEN
jgi:fermentation-respiration switch protein FrsA (DUF1100 family)